MTTTSDCTLLGNMKEVNGTGTLTTNQFMKDNGEFSLHLYDVTLLNSAEQSIVSTHSQTAASVQPRN